MGVAEHKGVAKHVGVVYIYIYIWVLVKPHPLAGPLQTCLLQLWFIRIPESFDLPILLVVGAGTKWYARLTNSCGAGWVGTRLELADASQGTGSSHAKWQHSFWRRGVVRPQANNLAVAYMYLLGCGIYGFAGCGIHIHVFAGCGIHLHVFAGCGISIAVGSGIYIFACLWAQCLR